MDSHKLFSLSLCCLSLSFLPHAAFAEEEATSPHEALLLKRIVEYWKDEDYALAKKQILDFLSQYEKSAFKDHLMAMLGDLYFSEGDLNDAVQSYACIMDEDFKAKTRLKHLKALFELGEYPAVEQLASPHIQKTIEGASEEALQLNLLYADALYRQDKLIEALPYFEALELTAYREYCLLPLAEGYRAQKDFPKAVVAYRSLLDLRTDKKDEILFQIASLEAEYDKATAAKTFLEITTQNSDKSGIAAFNFLTLTFDQNQYEALIDASAQLLDKIPEEHLALARYYVGCAHFSLKNYDRAIPALEAYVQMEKDSSPRLKTALLNLMLCARETQDVALSERILASLATHFSNDPAYLQSFLISAQLQKDEGNLSLNSDELKKLLDLSTEFEGREKIFYDVALLLIDDAKWEAGRDILLFFLDQYPQSEKRSLAYRHLLNTSIEGIKNEPASDAKKELFISDLQRIFSEEGVLTDEEAQEYRLSYAKTLYELKRPLEALREAEEFLTRYPGNSHEADVHLMAALCVKEGGQEPLKAAMHLEKALFLNPEQSDAHLIHLQLFNTYLSLATQDEEKSAAFMEQASDHLYEAFMKNRESVSFDNQIWLANHYYSKVKKQTQNQTAVFDEGFVPLKRSLATYEKIWGFEEGVVTFPKNGDPLLLEGEAMKYADLLSLRKEIPKKILFLETLSQLFAEKPDVEWKHQKQSLFELAKAYEMQSNTVKAIEIYDRLLQNHTPSYLTHAAQLQKTRLQFALLPAEERQEDSAAMVDILNQLKDLQIKKQLQCEPVHFEAALEYVAVRVALTAEESKLDKHLFYLKRVKEDFLSDDDVIGKEYLEARKNNPDKDRLIGLYMNYVDAEMVRLQGEKAKVSGQTEEAHTLLSQASDQFNQLLNDPEALTPFLKDRIVQSKERLQQVIE